jgi:hypothetical protein
MRTDALYSAYQYSQELAELLIVANTYRALGKTAAGALHSADRELHKLALALGYHLTPASQPATIEHEPVGGLTR